MPTNDIPLADTIRFTMLRRVSRSALLVSIWLVLLLGRQVRGQDPNDKNISELLKKFKACEQDLITQLKKDELWTEATNKFINDKVEKNSAAQKKLLQLLTATEIIRSVRLAPALVKRIGYSPYDYLRDTKLLSMEDRYPVLGALKAIGVSAVPALMEELRLSESRELLQAGMTSHDLIIRGLIAIYQEGGQGKEMARARIELEAKKTMDIVQRQRLLKALTLPILQLKVGGAEQGRAGANC